MTKGKRKYKHHTSHLGNFVLGGVNYVPQFIRFRDTRWFSWSFFVVKLFVRTRDKRTVT